IELIKYVQHKVFKKEIKRLNKQEPLPENSELRKHAVFIDEQGLIRLESRLSQSNDLNHDQVYPIFIPSASGLVWALIDDAHDRVGHMQVSGTMEAVRDQFFIPRLTSATEKVIRLCRTCRVLRG